MVSLNTISLKEWRLSFLQNVAEYEKKAAAINASIDKKQKTIQNAEKAIERLRKKHSQLEYPNWVDALVKPIGESLSKVFGMPYDIYGPFGIRCATTIYWMKEPHKSITEQSVKRLTLIPGDLRSGELYYETGKRRTDVHFPNGSIGEVNGMNQEILPLPDSLEEILSLVVDSE